MEDWTTDDVHFWLCYRGEGRLADLLFKTFADFIGADVHGTLPWLLGFGRYLRGYKTLLDIG